MSYPYRLEPIVDLITGEVVGQELLAGEHACPVDWGETEWRDWYDFLAQEIPLLLSGLHPPSSLLFVNLDGHQLLDEQIATSVRSLRDHAPRMAIEWTEHHFHDIQLVDIMVALNSLKACGFHIAIDDIGAGTGVDGLGRAATVKAHFCKIDGPYFQKKIREEGPESLRGLCQHLSHHGARVIVEWVETEEDYRLALASGAHLGQGWFWRKQGES